MCRNQRRLFLFSVVLAVFALSISWQGEIPLAQAETDPRHHPAGITGFPVGGQIQVSQEPVDSVQSSIAYNSTRNEYLVVWYNDRQGNDDIQAQRLDGNGKPVGASFFIAAGPGIERRNPDVAYNPKADEYYVVWDQEDSTSSRIHGRQISATGQLLSFELDIASGPALAIRLRPAIAYSSTSDHYLVVWENQPFGGVSNDVKGIGVSGGGYANTTEFYIAQGTWNNSLARPDVVYNRRSNEFLVVYENLNKTISPSISDIYGRIVRGNCTPASGDIPIATVGKNLHNPAVGAIPRATAKGQYLVAWEWHDPVTGVDIAFSLWDGDGTPLSGNVSLASMLEDERFPAVVGSEDTNTYLIAWRYPSSAPVYDVDAREVDTLGVEKGKAQRVGRGPQASNPAIASGSGDFMIVFEKISSSSVLDIFSRLWGSRIYLPSLMKN